MNLSEKNETLANLSAYINHNRILDYLFVKARKVKFKLSPILFIKDPSISPFK
jgi:hypothetical protein